MGGKIAELKDRLRTALDLREKKAIDLVRDLEIPKAAISQYLSGKSLNMDSERLHIICKYLNVSEPWMLGFDVEMERNVQKKADTVTDAVLRMKSDPEFLSLVDALCGLDADQINSVKQLIAAFLK